MRIVLDTNVLYQALRSSKGASRAILELMIDFKIDFSISTSVLKEYEEVLKRKSTLKDIKADINDVDKLLAFIAYAGKEQEIFFALRPNLSDEDDNQFVELAISSNADYLVTSNTRDYLVGNNLKFNDLRVVTPTEFMKIWRKKDEN